jgi:phytoene dehydrogenase-like protein
MSTKPHVGIIGAGFSGLRCADILVQSGARVTILEARDRIGGRVGFSPAVHATFAFLLASCHGESEIVDLGVLLIGLVSFCG